MTGNVINKYNFQYCQKIVVFSKDELSVLLCKRKGEADFDEIFTFIGGKMEITDSSIIDGLKREKNEEVGEDFRIGIFPTFSINLSFVKKDGSHMILPHYYAIHEKGEIQLNEEYSEFQWVPLAEVAAFEPKVFSISEVINKLAILREIIYKTEIIEI
ncbi:MAG: NUDIX hydrolase [Patescibacteria group bacterium]